jgi:hypothetical protein
VTGVVPSSTSHSHVIHALISQDNVTRLASHMRGDGSWRAMGGDKYVTVYADIPSNKASQKVIKNVIYSLHSTSSILNYKMF